MASVMKTDPLHLECDDSSAIDQPVAQQVVVSTTMKNVDTMKSAPSSESKETVALENEANLRDSLVVSPSGESSMTASGVCSSDSFEDLSRDADNEEPLPDNNAIDAHDSSNIQSSCSPNANVPETVESEKIFEDSLLTSAMAHDPIQVEPREHIEPIVSCESLSSIEPNVQAETVQSIEPSVEVEDVSPIDVSHSFTESTSVESSVKEEIASFEVCDVISGVDESADFVSESSQSPEDTTTMLSKKFDSEPIIEHKLDTFEDTETSASETILDDSQPLSDLVVCNQSHPDTVNESATPTDAIVVSHSDVQEDVSESKSIVDGCNMPQACSDSIAHEVEVISIPLDVSTSEKPNVETDVTPRSENYAEENSKEEQVKIVVTGVSSPEEEAEKRETVTELRNSPVVPMRRRSIMQNTSPRNSPAAPPRRRSSIYASQTSISRNSTSTYSLPRSPLVHKEASKPAKKRSMFSWIGGDSSKKKNKEVLETVSEGLRKIYKQKLHPLEEHYKFHEFHSPALDDPDFDAKPMILLVGQYSTGKTTFIRFLLEKDFPGIRIGPEPTTDRFIAVMHGDEEGVIPGNALVVDAKKQFRALSGFGNAFLNRFQCSTLPNQVLESVSIIDTPGILSGEKQRIDRGYDFTGVLEWFAERVDRIILLFDAHKLDISDEFKRCIEALSGNEDKIRIVLNKSDMVDHQQLMRVYGALMWSLGKVFRTPEVARVYIGSFWDQPLHYDINRRLFQDEQQDLFQDLQALPRNAALRKLNDLIKRARLAKVHAYIIAELRKQMPTMIGKEKKKKELIQNLDKIFDQLQREHNISPGDFPDVNKMREKLQNQDFTKFNPIKPKLLEVVDGMLASDIARLMSQIPKEEQAMVVNGGPHEQPSVKGGAFSNAQETETPFGFGKGEGFDKGADENEWVVSRERNTADSTFNSLGPVNGYLSGRIAKEHMVKSKLPNAVLGKIWKLADVDKDGQLDNDEFALANYLINLKLEGHELPNDLPGHLVPPSKRNVETVYPTLEDE